MEALLNETRNDPEKYNYKVSDEEFLNALKQNFCLYSETARYINEKYGIAFSKQAVQQRAKKFEQEIRQYKDEIRDLAHRTIFEAIKQDKDMKLRYRAAIFMLGKIDRTNYADSDNTNNE
jgi:hypothetical protein